MLLVPLQYFHHYPPKDLPVLPGSVPQSPALSSPPASALWSVPDPVPVFLPVLAPASLPELVFLLAPWSLPASSPPVLPYRSSYSSPYQADCSRSPEFLPKYCQRSSSQHSVQVDTAVGTARLVNRTAKTASPLRIMHTDTIIERHPVINRRPVILTLQDRIFLLIGQRIRACRSSPAFRQVSRYEIRLYHQLSFFIEEKVPVRSG